MPVRRRHGLHVAEGVDDLDRIAAFHADVDRDIGRAEILDNFDRAIEALVTEPEQHQIAGGSEIDHAGVLPPPGVGLAGAQGERRGVRAGRIPHIGRNARSSRP